MISGYFHFVFAKRLVQIQIGTGHREIQRPVIQSTIAYICLEHTKKVVFPSFSILAHKLSMSTPPFGAPYT